MTAQHKFFFILLAIFLSVHLGTASPTNAQVCEDLFCGPGEDAMSCPADCGFCGDFVCDPYESFVLCPDDCFGICGDLACEPGEELCSPDCDSVCGDLICDPGEDCPLDCFGGEPVCENDSECDDDDACTEDICDQETGCSNEPIDCDDGNICTADSCDSMTGCVNEPIPNCCESDADCDDNNMCNGTETCNTATHQCESGTPVDCDDGKFCNGEETCDPANGQCIAGTPPDVDDGIFCTIDTCHDEAGALHTPDNGRCSYYRTCSPTDGCIFRCRSHSQCDDGNPCNGQEFCHWGRCRSGHPPDCSDGNACNGKETCNPAGGCDAGEPLECDDGIACNGVETCNDHLGCLDGEPLECPEGQTCDQEQDMCIPSGGDGGGGGSVDDVFGFEGTEFWQIIQGSANLAEDTYRKTEGAASLRMNGNNFVVIESSSMDTEEITGENNTLSMDIYIGGYQPNPYYAGAVQLYAHCPSCGIYNQYLSQVELTPLPKNRFVKVDFSIPGNVIQALEGSHDDFTWRVSLNANPGAGPYYFDNLRFKESYHYWWSWFR